MALVTRDYSSHKNYTQIDNRSLITAKIPIKISQFFVMFTAKVIRNRLFSTKKTYKLISYSCLNIMTQTPSCQNHGLPVVEFSYDTDVHNGIMVKSEKDYCESSQFADKLKEALPKWSENGVRAVWFQISLEHSNWIPILTENNFVFHRVLTDQRTLVMYRWLPNEPDTVPRYAHTMVGVGGIVLNEKNELLTVLERYGSRLIRKLPGGYVEGKEDLQDAVIREIKEETGVETEFISCISFRHTHGVAFGCCDLYFIAELKPLTNQIHKDTSEVLDANWVSIEEYLNDSNVHELNKQLLRHYLKCKGNGVKILKETGAHPITQRPYSLYKVDRV